MSDDLLEKRKIRKRKYSRKGCKECKRRKIKCDETLPDCNNCSRLNKMCVYELNGAKDPSPGPKVVLQMRHYTQTLPSYTQTLPKRAFETQKVFEAQGPPETPPQAQIPAKSPQNVVQSQNYLNGSISAETTTIEHPRPQNVAMAHALPPLGPPQPVTAFLPAMAQGILTQQVSPTTLSNLETEKLFDEASLLVQEMNDLLGSDLLESFVLAPHTIGVAEGVSNSPVGTYASPISNSSEDRNHFQVDDFISIIHEDGYVNPSGVHEHLVLSNLQLIDQCIAGNSLEEPHVSYLRTVTTTDILYHLYPFASLIELNEVVKLLLTYSGKCPYLLSSLLAISATFQFNQTGKASHDRVRKKYITVCLQALSDAFAEHSGSKNTAFFFNNIEKLLLTVLVLTSYFTATTSTLINNILNSWKAHLRGARDLLMHYSQITNSVNTSQFMSGGLAVAKCWFFILESSAALYAPLGDSPPTFKGENASLLTPDEIYKRRPSILHHQDAILTDTGVFDRDVHSEYHDALSRVNILCTSPTLTDFNLYYGYTSGFVKVILHLCSLIDTMRVNGLRKCPYRWVVHLMKLIDEAAADSIVPKALPETFEVPITSIGHPGYTGPDKVVFPNAVWVIDVDEAGSKRYYSWFDASQQLHVAYVSLWTLVSPGFMQLPRTHAYVQDLVSKVFAGCFFIKSKSLPRYLKEKDTIVVESDNFYLSLTTFDMRCVMVQSIFRLLAGLVVEDEYFERIELFFMGLVKLGNGSSLNSLDIVARFKELRKAKKEQFPEEVDTDVYEYTERSLDIPFA